MPKFCLHFVATVYATVEAPDEATALAIGQRIQPRHRDATHAFDAEGARYGLSDPANPHAFDHALTNAEWQLDPAGPGRDIDVVALDT